MPPRAVRLKFLPCFAGDALDWQQMVERAVNTLRGFVENLNWACWLGRHHWQRWFELTVCTRCQQVGFRPR
jgi:hypothetical protein